jgi:hypothetical protein
VKLENIIMAFDGSAEVNCNSWTRIRKVDEGISAENAVMLHGAVIVSIRRADND